MPVETATYISDLNPANPPGTDGLAQADEHLRLIKSTLQSTFPNVNGAVTVTDEQLNSIASAIDTSQIANDAVTYAKMQNVSTTDKLLGRVSSGAGDVEEIACTAAGRNLLDDVDASAQRTTLGLGTIATQDAATVNISGGAIAGASVSSTSLAASQSAILSGVLSPAQLTASQNDYAPTGHATASSLRLDLNANWSITGLAGGAAGRILFLHNISSSTLTLVHTSGSSTAANQFICPYGANVQIRNGGGVILQYDGTSSKWRVLYLTNAAAQADMENAGSGSIFVTPYYQANHPGHPKFWAYVSVSGGTPTLQTSYNVTSITDSGVGALTVTIGTDFSSANWCCLATVEKSDATNSTNDNLVVGIRTGGKAAGSVVLDCWNTQGPPVDTDPPSWSVMGLGDQ